MTPPPALLVVGHGTRHEAGAEAFQSFVRLLGERNPGLVVGGGFVEPDTPPLGDTVAELVAVREVREFVVVPLALGPADHADRLIREALRCEQELHPEVSFRYEGRALGPRPQLLDLLERRLDEALEDGGRTPSDRLSTTVLLVGRGSADSRSNAELCRAARLLWEGRGYASVETAFVSQAAPDVPAGLDRCAKLGAGAKGKGKDGRIVVLPYFLFDGVLPDRLRQQAEGWAEARKADVRFAGVIGAAEELADVVMERYGRMALDADGEHVGAVAR